MPPSLDRDTRRGLLAIAYIFPPFASVGESIRVVKFLKYLPRLGWRPMVLTIDDQQDYANLRREGSEELLKELSQDVAIHRTGSGEPSANLIARGRAARERSPIAAGLINVLRGLRRWVQRWLMIPDEYVGWVPFAVRAGRGIIRDYKPDVLFATCPPHSALIAGALLKKWTGKPLVLDFRDDWVDTPWYRCKPKVLQAMDRLLERWVVKVADRTVLVTPFSLDTFRRRYPHVPEGRFVYIPNGVDLAEFSAPVSGTQPSSDGLFRVVHAGALSVAGDWRRSPEGIFRALALIRDTEPEIAGRIRLELAGALPEAYRVCINDLGIESMVKHLGYVPRRELAGLLGGCDLLLAMNYEGFSTIVPAKIYEYWAAGGPPILLLSQPGAAQDLVAKYRLGVTVVHDDSQGIADALLDFYRRREIGEPVRISREGVEAFDRRQLTARLAQTLEEVIPSAAQRKRSNSRSAQPEPVGGGSMLPPVDGG